MALLDDLMAHPRFGDLDEEEKLTAVEKVLAKHTGFANLGMEDQETIRQKAHTKVGIGTQITTPAVPGEADVAGLARAEARDTTEVPEEPGFFNKVGESYKRNFPDKDFGETTQKGFMGDYEQVSGIQGVRELGKVGRFVTEVGIDAIKRVYKGVVPDKVQMRIAQDANEIIDSPAGREIRQVLGKGVEHVREYIKDKPEAKQALSDMVDIMDAAIFIPEAQIIKGTSGEIFNVARDVAAAKSKTTIKSLTQDLTNTVNQRMPAIIKKGKMKAEVKRRSKKADGDYELSKFNRDSNDLVENIVKLQDDIEYSDVTGAVIREGGVPTNIEEGFQAVLHVEDHTFRSYNTLKNMAKESGDLSTDTIVEGLEALLKKPWIAKDAGRRGVVSQIKNDIKYFKSIKTMNLDDMQGFMAHLNQKTKSFQANPNPNLVNAASVDVVTLDRMRHAMEKKIMAETGDSYQALRNSYGAAKRLEDGFRDAVKRHRVKLKGDAMDLSDVLTGGTAIYAWSNLNAALIGATAGAKAIKTWHNWRTGVNHQVKVMFSEADEIIKKRDNFGYNPRSGLGKYLRKRNIERYRKAQLKNQGAIEGTAQKQIDYDPSLTKDFTMEPGGTPDFVMGGQGRQIPFEGQGAPQIGYDVSDVSLTRGRFPIDPVGSRKTAKGQPYILTGNEGVDDAISLALATPPHMRTPDQDFLISIIQGSVQ